MRAHHVGVFVAFFANDSINARKPSSPTRARVSRHDEKDLERAFLG
jgi:hypothetical protein